ncbi:MAG: tRNA (adenosine(37)-N6)-threonylcarbamoyltransferase complex ATPase subunit type 1 TsaE [Desulfopila sp.]|jgi:tRNA threonylcarbamoyladenosine biosynthesis protein TsaE|nr:tRNA (adenosine(37)-N6)-threonylcarbamoyltransferase complex ATPase subunit type 1 TsaE [Desulfopila sp.]
MKTIIIHLETIRKTETFGIFLGSIARKGDIICLDGDLGAGKTTLTQAIAQGLEVKPEYYVSSPSFALLHEYTGREKLYHMDFYRLHNSDDVINAGLEEYFYLPGVSVIEWSCRAVDILPDMRLSITLEQSKSQTGRVAVCRYIEKYWHERIEKLSAKVSGKK